MWKCSITIIHEKEVLTLILKPSKKFTLIATEIMIKQGLFLFHLLTQNRMIMNKFKTNQKMNLLKFNSKNKHKKFSKEQKLKKKKMKVIILKFKKKTHKNQVKVKKAKLQKIKLNYK